MRVDMWFEGVSNAPPRERGRQQELRDKNIRPSRISPFRRKKKESEKEIIINRNVEVAFSATDPAHKPSLPQIE